MYIALAPSQRGHPWTHVGVRTVQVCVNSGVPKKYYDTLRWGLLHLYGYDNLSTLQSIQHSGLIKKYEGGRNTFPQVKKAFRLVVDEVDDTAPTDISYVYSGYAPLSCR